MASQIRIQHNYLEEDVLINGGLYNYFQLLRILELCISKKENLTIRPELSLVFPVKDIAKLEKKDGSKYIVHATFLGLYGVSSPLPVFYTEQLIEDAQRGDHAAREFIDLIHEVTYSLFNTAWRRNKILMRYHELNDDAIRQFFDVFTGLRLYDSLFPVSDTVRKYLIGSAGLIFRRTKSISALRSMITNLLPEVRVEINALVKRIVPIPQDQQWRLGLTCTPSALCGAIPVLSYLGSEIEDYTGAIQIMLSAQTARAYARLMPGGDRDYILGKILRLFIADTTDIQIIISLRSSCVPSTGLGFEVGSRLGSDCWLPCSPAEIFIEGRRYVLQARKHFL